MLQLMEGFDQLSLSELAAKQWDTTISGATELFPSIGTGRIDGNCFRIDSGAGGASGSAFVHKAFPTFLTAFTVGFAYYTTTIAHVPKMFTLGAGIAFRSLTVAINSTGTMVFYNQAGSQIAEGTATITTGAWHYLEISYTTAAGGSISTQVDGAPDLVNEATGITDAVFDLAIYAEHSSAGTATGSMADNTLMQWDDIYMVDNTSPNTGLLGDHHVKTIFPDGAGVVTDWAPFPSAPNYGCVDENPPDGDTSYVFSSTIGDQDTYTFENITGSDVIGLQVNQYARKDTAGFRQVEPLIYTGGTIYEGAAQALPTSYVNLTTRYDENPDTSAAWTVSEVNGAEFGSEVA